MSDMMKLRARLSLAAVAAQEGLSALEVSEGIQEAIDAIWALQEGRERLSTLFPDGKPTPAEFVAKLASIVRERA